MKDEVWKDVVGYEGLYKVSNLGNVWSYYKNKKITPAKNCDGYLNVSLRKEKKGKTHKVHRLVLIAFTAKVEQKEEVNHIDNVRDNNVLANLEWVTRRENLAHTKKQNRHYKFPKRSCQEHTQAKLTNKKVLLLIKLVESGKNKKQLSSDFGISTGTINDILAGRRWSQLTKRGKKFEKAN